MKTGRSAGGWCKNAATTRNPTACADELHLKRSGAVSMTTGHGEEDPPCLEDGRSDPAPLTFGEGGSPVESARHRAETDVRRDDGGLKCLCLSDQKSIPGGKECVTMEKARAFP
ncbi:hypothetical protein WMY93_005486 [Mugilogobius chulae]|uniref:Uncharacterized protein n=1 Tax=Mugilogobius chulae TaxID=88201 RepID=A0AAW0PJU7_9GOBI